MSNSSKKVDHHPDRMFYTIGQVADMLDVNVSHIRYWEKEFEIIQPKRNAKGNRLFTPTDVDHFHFIYYLVKDCGLTLDGAKKKIDQDETKNKFEVVKRLKSIRIKLSTLEEAFKDLE